MSDYSFYHPPPGSGDYLTRLDLTIHSKERTDLSNIIWPDLSKVDEFIIINNGNLKTLDGFPYVILYRLVICASSLVSLEGLRHQQLSKMSHLTILDNNITDFSFLNIMFNIKTLRVNESNIVKVQEYLFNRELKLIHINKLIDGVWDNRFTETTSRLRRRFAVNKIKLQTIKIKIYKLWFSFFEHKRDKFNYNRLSYLCN